MLLKYIGCMALCFLHGLAPASQSEVNGIVTLSGQLTIEEYKEFSRLLESQIITTVVFKDCLGGNQLAAFRYAEKIKEKNITTIASRVVASGCAFAYLGGKVRMLDPSAAGTVIMFHGSFHQTTLEPQGPLENQILIDVFEKHIDFRFGPVVQKIILNTRNRDEGVYFYNVKSEAGVKQLTLYCDGLGPISLDKCKRLDGITLASEGITTK